MILILIIICGAAIAYACHLRAKQIQTIEINEKRLKFNQELEKEIKHNEKYLAGMGETVKAQNNIYKSLLAGAEKVKAEAKERAEEEYQKRLDKLMDSYAQEEALLKEGLQQTQQRVLAELETLDDLKAKQRAYMEAKQREASDSSDHYLALDTIDLNDVTLLRDLQKHFSRKESIDKLIWENYYKAAFDNLSAKFFNSGVKTCGIYRITSRTTGQSYIGQSVDIRERWRQHIKAALTYGKPSNKLYQAMQDEGPENFFFEILEEVPKEKLNEREVFWIDFYRTKEAGLNVQKGGA